MLAQAALFLSRISTPEAMLERQGQSIMRAYQFDVMRRGVRGLEEQVTMMRVLEGQKLKQGRDVFGLGTQADPFRFRQGLLYHEAFYHYLRQEKIEIRDRRLEQFAAGFGDRVEDNTDRVLYFFNGKPSM